MDIKDYIPCMMFKGEETKIASTFAEVYELEDAGWYHSPTDKERKYPKGMKDKDDKEPQETPFDSGETEITQTVSDVDETGQEEESPADEFVCGVCGKSCASKAGLLAHIRKAHPEVE